MQEENNYFKVNFVYKCIRKHIESVDRWAERNNSDKAYT